jgi:hypothetical protein
MNRKFRCFALVLIALLMFACNRRGSGDIHVAGDTYTAPQVVINSPYKVRVSDVFNDTHEVFDVDIIGLLWNGIEDSLKKRGMLWNPKAEVEPYVMEGHILSFKKGEMAERFVPYLGDTLLQVRVELSRGGSPLATIEVKRKIAFGSGTLTRAAWRKIFDEVSEEVVNQSVKKF